MKNSKEKEQRRLQWRFVLLMMLMHLDLQISTTEEMTVGEYSQYSFTTVSISIFK